MGHRRVSLVLLGHGRPPMGRRSLHNAVHAILGLGLLLLVHHKQQIVLAAMQERGLYFLGRVCHRRAPRFFRLLGTIMRL